MNTIHVNAMTRALGGLFDHGAGGAGRGDFAAEILVRSARERGFVQDGAGAQSGALRDSAEAQGTGRENEAGAVRAGVAAVRDMSMEEYKQYIHDRISRIPMDASHMQDTISITITDEGFAAMKNDPEYEEWVLQDLRNGWAQVNPWAKFCGGVYSTIHYGATKEECHAEMWHAGFRHGKSLFEEKSKESFWERRMKRHEEIQEQTEKQRQLREMGVAASLYGESLLRSGKKRFW